MMIDDVSRTVAFYRDVLGFEVEGIGLGSEGPAWVLVKRDGAELLFQARDSMAAFLPIHSPPPGTLTIFVAVADVESYHRLVAARVEVVRELQDVAGRREFTIRDCNGFLLTFAESLAPLRRAA